MSKKILNTVLIAASVLVAVAKSLLEQEKSQKNDETS